jgi:protease YdgD
MFARNYDRSRDLARVEGFASQSSSQNVLTGDFHLSVRPPIDAAYDWALMRLSRPVCVKHVLPVKVLTTKQLIEEAQLQRVFQISYHRDYKQWKPAYSRPCGIAQDFENADWSTIAPDFLEPDRMILHTCDTGGASSGSPILLETEHGPTVIGINVGTYVQSKVVIQNGQAAHRQKAETVANTAVNASAFADKIALLRGAAILTSAGAIKGLQEGLQRRSFYAGRIDGTYGPSLRTAIQAYERANTLPVTGLATQDLLRRLSAEGSVVPTGSSHSPSSGQK